MTEKKLNTIYEFEFFDGTTTELTLAFYKLYQLKAQNKAMYDRYMKIMSKKDSDEFELIEVLHIAYICAHMGEDDLMDFEEFMYKCGSDRRAAMTAVRALTQPKKK
jgi:hypothetical protein